MFSLFGLIIFVARFFLYLMVPLYSSGVAFIMDFLAISLGGVDSYSCCVFGDFLGLIFLG
jgi:hypothetical protein